MLSKIIRFFKPVGRLFYRNKFYFYRQLEGLDCAPACLKMILKFYKKEISLSALRDICLTNKLGTSIYTFIRGAKILGLESAAIEISINKLRKSYLFPCVLHWNKNHFIVLYGVNVRKPTSFNKFFSKRDKWLIADPGFGMIELSEDDFLRKWTDNTGVGLAIIFEPSENFEAIFNENSKEPKQTTSYISEIRKVLIKNKKELLFVFFGMILSSLVYLSFPLLTQRLVDIGINYHSFNYIQLILLFQLGLFLSVIIIGGIGSLILLYVGARIEINLTYDFLTKIMKLPLFFFESKVAGDLMQRINDNSRIQFFIKNQLLEFVIAITNFIALTVLIINYNFSLFVVFITGSFIAFFWGLYFIKKRELLDYRRFDINTENSDNLIETIISMAEIKLNSAEEIKRSTWQKIQLKLFDVNSKIALTQQYQTSGTTAINQLKNITITFLAATQVLNGTLSLGEMVSLSFIIGQLSLPLSQIISFFQYFQEAKISFTRLAEIQNRDNEDKIQLSTEETNTLLTTIKTFDNITINNLSFSYSEDHNDLLFENLSLSLERGKITAIVGASGSGKTTLLKLLLKYYEPLDGEIKVGQHNLLEIPTSLWRKQCGVVQQEGHVFSDTVENNIAISDKEIDRVRLINAAKMACIDSTIDSLPMKYSTKIGNSGIGLSTGQKQRILIARAIYKNPSILLLDEATSALDSTNEKEIQNHLDNFFQYKTVLIIAHRLSTVKNADKIIVLDAGKIVETGTHVELVANRDIYYRLVENQLELGN